MVKRSIIIDNGLWEYEFLEKEISVKRLDEGSIPKTDQWIEINPNSDLFSPKYNYFYLEGTNNKDITLFPIPLI